jgi:transglutaminase-like putative cysteine protease
MKRREFLTLSAGAMLLAQAPWSWAQTGTEAPPGRKIHLSYDVSLLQEGAEAYLWLPVPVDMRDYQSVSTPHWRTNADTALITHLSQVSAFHAHWRNSSMRNATLSMECTIRDRATDFNATSHAPAVSEKILHHYLQPSEHMPIDGIVLRTSQEATRGAFAPLQKARAIYDWVVDNTFREPKVKGCGRGDIKTMLETGNLGGKCADINALFVGLCRAAGIPAREVYGIRVAESRLFPSLGKSGDVSRAQHCRAEFYIAGIGWVPVDAADVRKAVLEDRLALDHPSIIALRERLFGFWEMNWIAFNHERDIVLSPRHTASFFMYPCAEVAGTLSDSLDPTNFSYCIDSSEIA